LCTGSACFLSQITAWVFVHVKTAVVSADGSEEIGLRGFKVEIVDGIAAGG
jgi:hypothetical protein